MSPLVVLSCMLPTIPLLRLRSLRKKAGFTQADLGFFISRRPTTISKLELRKATISARSLLTCCILFDCTPEELLPELAEEINKEIKAKVRALKNQPIENISVRTLKKDWSLEKLTARLY